MVLSGLVWHAGVFAWSMDTGTAHDQLTPIESSVKLNTGRFLRTSPWVYVRDYGYGQHTQYPTYLGTPVPVWLDGRPLTTEADPYFNVLQLPINSLSKAVVNLAPSLLNPLGGSLAFTSRTHSDSIPFSQLVMVQGGHDYQQYRFIFGTPLSARWNLLAYGMYDDDENFKRHPTKYTGGGYGAQLHYRPTVEWQTRFGYRIFNDHQLGSASVYRRDYDLSITGQLASGQTLHGILYHTDHTGGGRRHIWGYRITLRQPVFKHQALEMDGSGFWRNPQATGQPTLDGHQFSLAHVWDGGKRSQFQHTLYTRLPAATDSTAWLGAISRVQLAFPPDRSAEVHLSYARPLEGEHSDRPQWVIYGKTRYRALEVHFTERRDPSQQAKIRSVGVQLNVAWRSVWSGHVGYQLTGAEHTGSKTPLPYVPKQRWVMEWHYRNRFLNEGLGVHAFMDSEFATRRHTDVTGEHWLGKFWVMNAGLTLEIYDFLVAYEMYNMLDTPYRLTSGYSMSPRHYRIMFRLNLWN